jgi:hypothetical protein
VDAAGGEASGLKSLPRDGVGSTSGGDGVRHF